MARIVSPERGIGDSPIAANSLDIDTQDLVTIKSWYGNKAVSWDKIYWLSAKIEAYDSDNQTVKKDKVDYIGVTPETRLEIEVTSGSITQADVGSKFNLGSDGNVNASSTAAVAQISTLTPANVEIGDIFIAIINGVNIPFTATATTVANVTAWLTAAINLSGESGNVTAVDDTTEVTITAVTAGTAFTISGTATNGWGNDTQTLSAATGTVNVEAVKQVDTCTLSAGTTGTADLTAAGIVELITFNASLTQTATDFVANSAADYATVWVVLTSSGAGLIFTAAVAGIAFSSPVVDNASDDIAWTTVNTTANVVAVAQISTATPANVEIGDVFTATINGTAVPFTATAATVANVTAWLTAAINLSAQAWNVTAVDSTTTVTITSDAAGTAFTITCGATAGTGADTQTLSAATGTVNVSADSPDQLYLRKVKTSTLGDFTVAK